MWQTGLYTEQCCQQEKPFRSGAKEAEPYSDIKKNQHPRTSDKCSADNMEHKGIFLDKIKGLATDQYYKKRYRAKCSQAYADK
jgi:hypothetical protein